MIPESRSWIQFPQPHNFSLGIFHPPLAYVGPVGSANNRGSHVGGEILNYSIRGHLIDSISPGFYG
jgi:hypothetical protein